MLILPPDCREYLHQRTLVTRAPLEAPNPIPGYVVLIDKANFAEAEEWLFYNADEQHYLNEWPYTSEIMAVALLAIFYNKDAVAVECKLRYGSRSWQLGW